MRSSLLALRKRSRRVVLASIVVHAIDAALDAVLAHATMLVTTRPEARAGHDPEVSAPVEPCRRERMRKPSPARRARRVGEGALSRPPGQRELRGEIVDSRDIVASDHPDALTAASTISPSLVRPALRHHAESALKSLASSGPTRLALSFLALFSAPVTLSERARAASLGGSGHDGCGLWTRHSAWQRRGQGFDRLFRAVELRSWRPSL
jgi:hypothetical protein